MSNTLAPFLYQTRTLQRLPSFIFGRPKVSRCLFHSSTKLQARRRRDGDESIPFELPPGLDLNDGEAAGEESEIVSTITPTERKAFDSIFQEIASQKTRPDRSHLADNVINLVVQDAGRSSKSKSDPDTVVDRDIALDKFPPSLRKAARMALGALKDDRMDAQRSGTAAGESRPQSQKPGDLLDWADDSVTIDELVKSATIQEHRRSERNRVEGWMLEAESDFKLWKSLVKDVFRMVERLGIIPPARGPPKDQAEAKRRKKEKLDIYVHGPLYPLLLLRGLRLLDRAYDSPSPLTLSVLPRVRELGLASYVLGASTPFYNALLGINWYRYGNVPAVFDLLEEMRRAGLSFDEETLDLLRDMEATMESYADGEHGPFVKELAAMPEYEAVFDSRLPHWEKVIQRSISDQKREAAL